MPRAYLIAEVLEIPYPLEPDLVAHIGRSGDNHIVLPAPEVSRHHASIRWAYGAFELVDLGSMNGTRVNGELVTRRTLAESDAIRIGPVELIFGANILESIPRLGDTDTAHDWGPLVSESSFAGVLSHLRPEEVWQMLELGQKTGRLLLQHDRDRGAVYFERGHAIHAELGEVTGEEAALTLLTFQEGTFRFLPSARLDVRQTIRKPSASILLEAARRSDEASRRSA